MIHPPTSIKTARLSLVSLTPRFLELCLAGDHEGAERELGHAIADEWWPQSWLMRMRLDQIAKDPALTPWLLRAVIRSEDGIMVGHFNGHTGPGAEYLKAFSPLVAVEIGYTIYEPHRRRGYAAEAIEGYAGWLAMTGAAEALVLSIAPSNQPSLLLAAKLRFCPIGESREVDEVEWVFARDLRRGR